MKELEEIHNFNNQRKSHILKSLGMDDDEIEKAQRQAGTTKVGADGVTRVWTQLPSGKFDWRRVKGSGKQSSPTTETKNSSKKEGNEKEIDDFKQKKIELENIEEDLKIKLDRYSFKKGQNSLMFSNNTRGVKSDISIEVFKLGSGESSFLVYCNTKKEVNSTSLANPRAAYQTTSARIVKHKRIKDQKHVDNVKDVYKIIDRHLNKIK